MSEEAQLEYVQDSPTPLKPTMDEEVNEVENQLADEEEEEEGQDYAVDTSLLLRGMDCMSNQDHDGILPSLSLSSTNGNTLLL